MLEAKTKEITIEAVDDDIDDDTVMRFVEYAYTGDYTVPVPDIVLTMSDIESQSCNEETRKNLTRHSHQVETGEPSRPSCEAQPGETVPEIETYVDPWGFSTKSSKKLSKKSQRNLWASERYESSPFNDSTRESKGDAMWKSFCEKVTSIPAEQWQPQARTDDSEDFTNVLLCHAQLYVFSNRWQCQDLRDVVLHKLRLTLSKYTVLAERIGEVVTLIEHTYTHTQDYANNGTDRLRDLVTDFAVCHIKVIESDAEFRNLLNKDSQIGRDLLLKVMQRLD